MSIGRLAGTQNRPKRFVDAEGTIFMRTRTASIVFFLAAACSKSPLDQQSQQIRSQAEEHAKAITQHADQEARPLEQQAGALKAQAKQMGGYDGKRLQVQADALSQQAKLFHKQADEQADAVKETADAQIKALRSR